jgi:uncharacterized membrane protein
MQFAIALPWWMLVLLAAAVVLVGWASYAGAIVPLTRARRTALSIVRIVTLLVIVACLLRPVRVMPPVEAGDTAVPVLVDVSRSMKLTDAGGRSRIDAARDLVQREVVPGLAGRFRTEVWTFGNALAQMNGAGLTADQGRSDLSGALRGVRDRYRDRRVAAVVVISDGGDTGRDEAASVVDAADVPVYTVGVGTPAVSSDFEVIDVSAGEAALSDSSIDLTVAAISRGSTAPFDLRVLENGRPVDVRRVTPAADGSPVHAVFTVSPARETPTLYTVEIPSSSGERVLENNRRSVLVEPPGRRRRILFVEGAPGFEHTFVKRAMTADEGIEVDSVVRKGRDAQGHSTFFVQSNADRAPRLASGFPQDREALYQYDALVLANVESDLLSRAQLDMVAGFVNDRGGGLLVLGAKTFEQRGLVGTPIEEVMPLGLTGRGTGVVRASARSGMPYTLSVTPEGESHPIMRIGATAEETSKRWAVVPALAGAAALGAPRPGAQVLALVHAPDGSRPLVAVQRYGQGRSMIFTGEASWRWRMQLPSTDRTFELFWRQAGRWLAGSSPDPVSIASAGDIGVGDTASLGVDVRSEAFAAVPDADVTMRVTLPGGEVRAIHPSLTDPRVGHYAGEMQFERPGIYRIAVDVRRASKPLASAQRSILVGGIDREMTDPRLNEDVLRRVARASGGQYLPAGEVSRLPALLSAVNAEPAAPRLEDLWHTPVIFAALVLLLAAEWILRRRWGLR